MIAVQKVLYSCQSRAVSETWHGTGTAPVPRLNQSGVLVPTKILAKSISPIDRMCNS